MQQPSKFAPVLVSSAIMVILSIFPVLNLINLVCCAGIIIGGAAGTYYYSRQLEKNGQVLQNKDGMMIGLLSGIIAAVFYVIFSTFIIMATKQNPVEIVYKMTEQYGFQLPPESEKVLQQVNDEYSEHGFSFLVIGMELFTRIVSNCIFGPLGGILAASLINKRKNAPK